MPLLREEAAKLSEDDLVRGVIEEFIDQDEVSVILPFTPTSGKAYTYNREKTLATGSWLNEYEKVTESASTFEEVTAVVRKLIGDVDIDKLIALQTSDVTSQLAVQIAAKIKGMTRQWRQAFITGQAANKQPDGLQVMAQGSDIIDTGVNGNALTFSILDELLDAVPNGADAIFMRPGTIRAYKNLLRTAGGLEPAMVMMEEFGRPMLTYNGVPILKNEFIAGDVTKGSTSNTCSIYAARLNEADGLHGIYPEGAPAGFQVENIGTVQDEDSIRTRMKAYLGLALKSTKSLASADGITNV